MYEKPPPDPNAAPTGYEIHAERQQVRDAPDRVGADPNSGRYECRVVKAPTKKLELPEGVTAGSTFELTVLGKKGTATILPVPDPQHPTETKVLGQLFYAEWRSNG